MKICEKCKKYCENRGHPELCDYGIKTQKLLDFLEKHEIGLAVWACGCCDSPQVKVTFKGEVIVDEEEFLFDNIESEPEQKPTLAIELSETTSIELTELTCQTYSLSSLDLRKD
jgi:hypothetical protein